MRGLRLALFASALSAACGQGGGVSPDGGSSSVLVLGASPTSGSGFLPAADGDDAELVPGAQGGFHVWITPRIEGVSGPLFLDREARLQSDGTLVLRAARSFLEVPDAALGQPWDSPYALPSFMCPAPLGVQVFDQAIVFRAVLLSEDEEILGSDELVLVPRCPDGDERDFCLEICAG